MIRLLLKSVTVCALVVISCTKTFGQDTILLHNYFRELKTIHVTIGGKAYNFLFDTGGGETFISPGIAADLKKGVYGRGFGLRMSGEKIYYGKCDSVLIGAGAAQLFHTTVGVWDVMSVLPKELPKIDGVISLKSFRNRVVSIDLSNNRLVIETVGSYREKITHMTLLDSRVASGPDGNELTVFLGAVHRQHLYWLLFDCGNISNCILSPKTSEEWGLQSDTIHTSKLFNDVGVAVGAKEYKIDCVVADIIFDGALNYELISKAVYVIDLIDNKVWSEPRSIR